MLPASWLKDELLAQQWAGSNTAWEQGATYNVFLVDNKFAGIEGSQMVFRGRLQCPDGHMMTCCVTAGGDHHVCSKDITKAAYRLVEWRIPRECVPEGDVHAFHHVALQNVVYTGVRIFTKPSDACDVGSAGTPGDVLLVDVDQSCSVPHRSARALADDGVSIGSRNVGDNGCLPPNGCDGKPPGPLVFGVNDPHAVVQSVSNPCPHSQLPHLSTIGLPMASQGGVQTHVSNTMTMENMNVNVDENPGDWGLGPLAPQEVKVLLFNAEQEVSQVYPKVSPAKASEDWSLVELFSGAFAGWKQASKTMTKLGVPWKSTHAVEIQEDIAKLYCKTFDVTQVFSEGDARLNDLFPFSFASTLGDTMFIGDVRNPDWIKLVPWGNRIIAAVSAPCPPWSRSSEKDGLHHADGRLTIATAIAMKFLQPLALVIENVDTMRDHRHFKSVRDTLLWAGYRMIWECASDLRKVAPIARKRWLAVFIRNQGQINDVRVSDFLELPQPNLESHKILMQLPWEHEKDLTLTGDLMDIYSDVRFATRSMRTKFFREQGRMTSQDVMNMRIRHGRAVLSTFLARYSSQHELSEQKLRNDGLFAELINGKMGVRFFSPFEIASAHGLTHDLYLPKNIHTAHLVVGNGIATQHAILAMTHARNYVDTQMRNNPQEMVLHAMRDRLHSENTCFLEDELGWWLKRSIDVPPGQPDSDDIDVTQEELTLDTILDSCSDSAEVPPTAAYCAVCQIQCRFPDSTHVYMTEGDMSLKQLLLQNHKSYALDFFALDEERNLVPWDTILRTDKTIVFRNLSTPEVNLVVRRAAWKVFPPGKTPCEAVAQIAEEFNIPNEGKILGRFRPMNDESAPVSAIHLPLARHLLGGVMGALKGSTDMDFMLKWDGCVIWDGPLPADVQLTVLDELLQCCMHILGFSPFTWIHGGKRLLVTNDTLGSLQKFSDKLKLSMIGRCRGGAGAKTEAWKEVKNQLAKLLIHKGWSLASLDEVTTEWIEKIGLAKLQAVLKTQLSMDRKWHSVMNYAKLRDLQVLPDDPIRMRAARTIQQALRKNKAAQLVASRFQIAEGFFMTHADKPLPVLAAINLKSTGVCLMDWEQATQYLSRDLPMASDELAIITLVGHSIPDDYPEHKEITFPALDDKQRAVILRGNIWQLGDQKVKWVAREQSVKQAPTLVVACTVWRDEVSEAMWDDFCRSLVKTTLALLVDVDTRSQILQVWGRSYRDDKSRCDPSMAHSAQFHCRVFADQAETILKNSGRNHVYITPKSENHLAHPGWSVLWFPDRMAVDIAASKATEHSGIVRVKSKYALRVRTPVLNQIAKEIKFTIADTDQVQIQHLYKVQPVPVGVTQEQVTEWAANLGWKVRVVKKLGRDAFLLGTDTAPPHPHLSLNGTVVLIKQVTSQKASAPASALVAGPRQMPVKEIKEHDTAPMELLSDPWAPWALQRAQQGLSTMAASPASARSSAKTDASLEGPIAQKFAAIEQRMQAQDQEMQKLTQDCQQLSQAMQSTHAQVTAVDRKVSGIEQHMQQFQRDVSASVESAIVRGLSSQDQKLDQKFEKLMHALQASNKRKEQEPDEDECMQTPSKEL
eukprot:Skav229533  [mRNA]  locus=scaffold451:267843:272915:+ [translate_table: standard]